MEWLFANCHSVECRSTIRHLMQGATTLGKITLGITTCSKTTLRTTTISITKNATLCITSLSIKFHNAEQSCSYAEWRVFSILLNVVMLSVVVPFNVRYVSTRIRYYIIVSKYIWFRLHILFIHGKHACYFMRFATKRMILLLISRLDL
jgi:hypothetical protein